MNRKILCLLLICIVALAQGLSLHAHLPHADDARDEHAGHQTMHIHSHAITGDSDAAHELSDALPIDLLSTAIIRDHSGFHSDAAVIIALWIFALSMLWMCIQRLPPIRFVLYRPPRFRNSSPRAPPR